LLCRQADKHKHKKKHKKKKEKKRRSKKHTDAVGPMPSITKTEAPVQDNSEFFAACKISLGELIMLKY